MIVFQCNLSSHWSSLRIKSQVWRLLNWEETKNLFSVFPWILEVNASKKGKKVLQCLFLSSTPRQKTTKSFCKERASKLAESNKGSYYNQEKRWQDDKASEKPIETTAESSVMSFLASGASFLGRKATKWGKKSQSEVPCHIKIGWRTFSEVYCSRREASRKTPGSSMLSILQGKCRTFRKYIEQKWAWLNLPCPLRK